MAGPTKVIMSISLVPNDVDANFEAMKQGVEKALKGIAESAITYKKVPLAFGLNSLDITFILDESKGSETVEKKLAEINGVQTVDIKGVSLYETKEFKPLTEETPKKEEPAKKKTSKK